MPTASKAGPTLQESTHKRRVEPDRLPKDAPNGLIALVDERAMGQICPCDI
jgi:arylsulfatase